MLPRSRAGSTWKYVKVATGKPEPEFVWARQLRARHNIPLTEVAKVMRQLLGRTVSFSGLSDWERGRTRPTNTERGKDKYCAWREAMRILIATAIIDELAQRDRLSDSGRPAWIYAFTEARETMLRTSPCKRDHTYLIELNDGAASNYGDVKAARAMFLAITPEWQPKWRACHDDGSECLLEAAFQTAMSVKEEFIHGGEDPSNPDLRRGQLIGVFVVLCANLLATERGGGDLRTYMDSLGTYVLRDMPRAEPQMFVDLVAWLEAIDKTESGGFPQSLEAIELVSDEVEGLARELVRKLVRP